MNRREVQLRALAEEEQRWCPQCHRVGRRLGDHYCSEPLTVDEARAKIQAQGGVLGQMDLRADSEGVERTFDAALIDLTETMQDLGAAIKVSSEAMETLKRAFTEAIFHPADDAPTTVSSYKGVPVLEDPYLGPRDFFVLSEREWEPIHEWGTDAPVDFIRRQSYADLARDLRLDSHRLGVLRSITA